MRIQKLQSVVFSNHYHVNDGDILEKMPMFAQLIQCLDDRSLSLVMRDDKENDKKALAILRVLYTLLS